MVTKDKWMIQDFGDETIEVYVPKMGMVAKCNRRTNEQAEANANIIVTAVNACKEINPDNPQAVAEGIKGVYEALKFLAAQVSVMGFFKQEKQEEIRQALAKMEEK